MPDKEILRIDMWVKALNSICLTVLTLQGIGFSAYITVGGESEVPDC